MNHHKNLSQKKKGTSKTESTLIQIQGLVNANLVKYAGAVTKSSPSNHNHSKAHQPELYQ